jgi:hypothetical protein
MYAPKLTDPALRLLNELRTREDFNTFLQSWKQQITASLAQADDHDLMLRLQGSIRTLGQLEAAMDSAPKSIQRRTQ